MCQRCSLHFCCKCVNISREEYKLLEERADIFWFCAPCSIKAKAVLARELGIEDCTNKMMTTVAAKMDELAEKIDTSLGKMKTEIPETVTTSWAETAAKNLTQTPQQQEKYTKEVSEVVKKTLVDQQKNEKQRESREGNLILYRVAESAAEDATERKDEDTTFFNSLCCEALEVGRIEITNITRLGKKVEGSNPRPLKVNLKNMEDKDKIFKRLRRLKDADPKFKISITHDLPPEDRKAVKAMVLEAKEKEKNQNEGGRWIFRVRGPPWDLKIIRYPAPADN